MRDIATACYIIKRNKKKGNAKDEEKNHTKFNAISFNYCVIILRCKG